MAVSPDSELVERLRRGEAAAFDVVYARYGKRLYGFLVRLTGRRDLADDLYQETWLRLARHAGRLAPETDLAGWLYTVARNQYFDHHRSAALDGERLRETHMLPLPQAAEAPDEAAAASDTRERLERALADLSPAHREVLLLVAVEGLAQDQVAQILGIENDAVRQRLSRARAQLSERLEGRERGARAVQ
ncbi:MAG TPA: RNA polymerase sigma factor [Polyangia bacterium]|nr:RNA polymerase sigma factor [Polyangia bacterium]